MKILIYAHLFPPSKGGMQYSNLAIAKGVSQLGHSVHVIACSNRGIRRFISNCPFSVCVLPKWHFTTMASLSRSGLLNWILAPLYFFIFFREIRKFNPDIALITDETANAFWGAISSYIRLPYVSYWSVPVSNQQGFVPRPDACSRLNHAILNQIRQWSWASYKRAKYVLVVSNSTRQQVSHILPEIEYKVATVPRAIDDNFFDAAEDSEAVQRIANKLGILVSDFVLLSVARLTRNKGIDDVLKALARIDPDTLRSIKYVIVGEGRHERYLKDLTASLRLNRRVKFIGAVDQFQLVTLYDMCDLFVLPSRRGVMESFGRVFAESAARRRASIGVDGGGMPDIINDGDTGFLLQAGDVSGIQNTIEYAATNREIIRKMGLNARLKAEKNYTLRAIAIKFETHLQKAVAGPTTPH
jgi:glycosyltransferase involved in cell wall biosynthesis